MAKKKKTHKKVHRNSSKGRSRSQSAQAPAVQPISAVASAQPAGALPASNTGEHSVSSAASSSVAVGRWSYVGKDLKRVGVLAAVCIIIEAIGWYVFNHTGVGPAIYSHINL